MSLLCSAVACVGIWIDPNKKLTKSSMKAVMYLNEGAVARMSLADLGSHLGGLHVPKCHRW